MPPLRICRAFVSFDFDHDGALKNLLVGQARHGSSPFVIEDWSIKLASRGWKADARRRIRRADILIIICGHHTHQAVGVSAELAIAKEEKKPYRLLAGRKSGGNRRPQGAWFWETMHKWTWENLRAITTGSR